jgi:hypothetical protein
MAQTALQELIEFIIDGSGNNSEFDILTKAQSLLPKERQIIEDAVEAGVNWTSLPYLTPSDYFTQNFNQ